MKQPIFEDVADELGKIAYDAYCETRHWKSFNGSPLPQWSEVNPDIKHGWITSAKAILSSAPARRLMTFMA